MNEKKIGPAHRRRGMSLNTLIWHHSLHLWVPSTAQPSGPFPWGLPSTRNTLHSKGSRGQEGLRTGLTSQPKQKPPIPREAVFLPLLMEGSPLLRGQ